MADAIEPVPASHAAGSLDRSEPGDLATDRGATRAWQTLRRNPVFWIGAVLSGGLVALAILAPLIAPYDPLEQFRDSLSATGEPAGPGGRFLLGTDPTGRDFLSRLIHGARVSLLIAIGANVIATVLGLAVGATAALASARRVPLGRGRSVGLPVDSLLMRATDLWLSFPVLLLTITLAFVLGPSVGLVIVIVGTTLWTATARIVYARTLVLRESDFVEASRALGASTWEIFARRMFPHLLPLLLVYASLGIAAAILFEATLSYLGAGVPPPTPTWGTMLADHISWFATKPRLVLLPGLFIMLTVLGFNLLGDALRDALDPRAWWSGPQK